MNLYSICGVQLYSLSFFYSLFSSFVFFTNNSMLHSRTALKKINNFLTRLHVPNLVCKSNIQAVCFPPPRSIKNLSRIKLYRIIVTSEDKLIVIGAGLFPNNDMSCDSGYPAVCRVFIHKQCVTVCVGEQYSSPSAPGPPFNRPPIRRIVLQCKRSWPGLCGGRVWSSSAICTTLYCVCFVVFFLFSNCSVLEGQRSTERREN